MHGEEREMSKVVGFLFAAVLWPLTALAEGPYVQGNFGFSIPEDGDISGGGLTGEADLDNAFAFGGAVGYAFDPIRAEIEISYRNADVDKVTIDQIGVLTGAGDVGILTPMLNAFVDFEIRHDIKPFIGGGIGWAFIDVETDSGTVGLVVNDDDSALAWNIIGGVSWAFMDRAEIVTFYRYLYVTETDFKAALLGVPGTLEADSLSAHEINVGLRFGF